jgi:rhodanese-related sulfurtransferase
MNHAPPVTEATAEQVHDWLANGEILLVDVREANEYAFERIPGAVLYPLSTFDPTALPTEGRRLVLHCASGMRSLRAAQALHAAGHHQLAHLAGGIQAWKAAGLPVIRVDPQTGRVVDDGRR